MKKYLFVLREAPHHGLHVQEILDVILTTAAFEQSIALLLLDDGVFQCKKNQYVQQRSYKDTAAIFKALEIYEIKTLYVEMESLTERGLTQHDLMLPTQAVLRQNIADLIQEHSLIFSA